MVEESSGTVFVLISLNVFALFVIPTELADNAQTPVFVTFEQFYQGGIDAYLENRWFDCVALLEKGLENFHLHHSLLLRCRLSCNNHKEDFSFPIHHNDTDNPELLFFEAVVKRAFCITKCERAFFHNQQMPSAVILDDFLKKVPYNYLQLCYYKTGDIVKAASCAYTFLIHNPDHEVMQTNLRYYLALPDMDHSKVQYLETEDYQEFYLEAAQLYSETKFEYVIEVMEKALQEYLLAEEKCRLLCEGPAMRNVTLDFYTSIANHFTSILRCKQSCPDRLSYMYGQKHDNLLSNHYHYLQFSYYKMDRMKEACQAVASYLLLHPNDPVMISNQAFYSKQSGVKPIWFSPRPEAINYEKRWSKELKLMKTIDKWFQFNKPLPDSLNFPTPPTGSIQSHNLTNISPLKKDKGKKRKKLSKDEIQEWFREAGIKVAANEKDLNGTLRASFLNIIGDEECQKMVHLAKEGAVYGDGYNGKESPHTEFEMFEGLSVARAVTLSQRGILDPLLIHLFLNVSERARQAVETYFNLDTELFFAYTHLACRTALADSPEERKDFSHPVHADNCILVPDGNCLKQRPAYTWRDFSSIVYLNEDFEGGEFVFVKDKTTIQASVKPKCGSMVAFSAGKENLHGVKAVKKGKRCALGLWYTLDPNHKERERDFAAEIIVDLIKKRQLLQLTGTSSYKDSVFRHFAGTESAHISGEDSNGIHQHSEL